MSAPTEAGAGVDEPIKAGMLSQGLSLLSFHALRADGTAACSSFLDVSHRGELARDIPVATRCKSRACQKLFAQANTTGATP